jgi:DNA protecting protein DprA
MSQTRLRNFPNLAENAYWLALQDSNWLIPTKKVIRSYEELGTLRGLCECSHIYLQSLDLDDKSISRFCDRLDRIRVDELDNELKYLDRNGMKLIRYIDDEYPSALKTGVDDPPLMLFHKGSLLNFENCVAMAGTRDCTQYGRLMAKRLAKAVASEGYTIVSGLARGTDEWAHSGALEAGGKSIAVLPWIKPLYPPEHSELLNDIEKKGATLSERLEKPVGKVARVKFVQRNRITSGIARCLIALESDEEGGTVHQVKIAVSQGRKVFAVKPKNSERFKKGFMKFVELGATPIKSSRDVLNYLRKEAPIRTRDEKIDSYYQHSLDSVKGSPF